VVNIANVAVMGHITKLAAVENQTAIWEYDPDLPGNHILGGSLDVIAAVRTIAIKVRSVLVMGVWSNTYHVIRFRPPVNISNILRACKFSARLIYH